MDSSRSLPEPEQARPQLTWTQAEAAPARALEFAQPSREGPAEEREIQKSQQPVGKDIGLIQMHLTPRHLQHELALIRNVSEKSRFYDAKIPYIMAFSNAHEQLEPLNLPVHISRSSSEEDVQFLNQIYGSMYCLGPGMFDIETCQRQDGKLSITSADRWTDGLAVMHRFQFQNDADGNLTSVIYRNRHIANSLEERLRKPSSSHFAQPNQWLSRHMYQHKWNPEPTIVNANHHLLLSAFPYGRKLSDPRTRDIVERSETQLLAMSDMPLVQEVDPVTLVPKKVVSLYQVNPQFGGLLTSTPLRDEVRGEIIQCVMDLGLNTATYKIFAISDEDFLDPPGHLLAEIRAPPTAHFELAYTPHYIILVRFPYRVAGGNWQLALSKKNLWSMKFDSEDHVYFHVIDRNKRREIAMYAGASCYALSIINAFETTNTIYVDMNAYNSDLINSCLGLSNLRKLGMPPLPDSSMRRFSLSVMLHDIQSKSKKTLEAPFSLVSDFPVEFGAISPRDMGSGYRYCYGLSISPELRSNMNQIWNSIICIDTDSKTRIEWKSDGCFPGPPVFVDIGYERDVVMSVVLDSNHDSSFVLMLDSNDLRELARVKLPFAVPLYRSIYFLKRP